MNYFLLASSTWDILREVVSVSVFFHKMRCISLSLSLLLILAACHHDIWFGSVEIENDNILLLLLFVYLFRDDDLSCHRES